MNDHNERVISSYLHRVDAVVLWPEMCSMYAVAGLCLREMTKRLAAAGCLLNEFDGRKTRCMKATPDCAALFQRRRSLVVVGRLVCTWTTCGSSSIWPRNLGNSGAEVGQRHLEYEWKSSALSQA